MRFALAVLAVAVLVAVQGELVIVKEGTGLYHRPGCDVVRDGKDVLAMSRGQAEARGYTAHPDCDPSRQPPPAPDAAGAPGKAATKPAAKAAPIFVYVDTAGTLYHRAECRRLGKDPKKVTLDPAVAKKYWPCGACKPPILPRKNKKPWIDRRQAYMGLFVL